MTILLRLAKPGMDLWVCGTPDRKWLDSLLTATAPMTAEQLAWREAHRVNLEREGVLPPSVG